MKLVSAWLAYAVHPFYYTDGQTGWDTRWGDLPSSQAVIATAWNYKANACGTSAQTMAPQFLSYMRNTVNVGIIGHSLDVFTGQLMADPGLAPTQCATSSPGGGEDFLTDYMDTFFAPPQMPSNLAASPGSPTEVDLVWEAVSDPAVVGYDVYRNGSLIGTSTAPSFSDGGLSPMLPTATRLTLTILRVTSAQRARASRLPRQRTRLLQPRQPAHQPRRWERMKPT